MKEVPFLVEKCQVRSPRLHLLPTSQVVIVMYESILAPTFVFPHRQVVVVEQAVECGSLSPNVVKCLLGEPRRFLGAVIEANMHPMLSPFVGSKSIDDIEEILTDLRRSLKVTPDEREFLSLWAEFVAGELLPTSDRRVQRLCTRFAGQAPKAINIGEMLARTLVTDDIKRTTNGLADFADASHLIRVCRAYTGKTPTSWKNLSQTFY